MRRYHSLRLVGCPVEIRWCPAHEGIAESEQADAWTKLAADEPEGKGGGALPLLRPLLPMCDASPCISCLLEANC